MPRSHPPLHPRSPHARLCLDTPQCPDGPPIDRPRRGRGSLRQSWRRLKVARCTRVRATSWAREDERVGEGSEQGGELIFPCLIVWLLNFLQSPTLRYWQETAKRRKPETFDRDR